MNDTTADKADTKPLDQPIAPAGPVAQATARPQVLLVSHQPARLLTYESILEGVGVDCVRADSEQHALELLSRHAFATVVLDISTADLAGFQTAHWLKDHPGSARPPILLVTGERHTELDVKGYEIGVVDHVALPVVPELFRSKIALLAELHRRRQDLERLSQELQATRSQLRIERYRAAVAGQTALRDSQRRYKALFQHAVELIAVLEAVRAGGEIVDWRYQDANENSLRLFGVELQQLRGRLLTEMLPSIAPRLIGVCRQVLESGEPYHYESRFSGRAFLVSFFPMGHDTVGTSALDITARSRAEEEARRLSDADRAEKEWLAAVLDSMTEEVYFTDRQQRYTYANPAALREFGHATVAGIEVDRIVRSLEVLRPDGTPRPIEEAPPLRALAGEVIREEEQIVRIPRTNEWRYRQVSAAPVRDATGEIIGSVSVARDVTDERLALAQLREREQQLLEADRRKDEFLAVLAHELRNPLVPIRNGVDLLEDAQRRPGLIETVRPMMQRHVQHMVRLIDDLLDVSRITSGKIQLHRQWVTLGSVIESAVESNRHAIATGGLTLRVEVDQPRLMLSVDPTRFTQVIANLLQNAAKFTPPGGQINVEAGVEASIQANVEANVDAGIDAAAVADDAVTPMPRVLTVTVTDTGAGVAAEFLPRIFDLFAQAQAPAAQDGAQDGAQAGAAQAGLGIGLTLARRLIELHGGSIEAHSEGVGCGSRFVVRLPLPEERRARPERESAGHGTVPSSLSGTRVLVIDDNRDAADVMAMLIEQLGGQAGVAYSGASGIEAVRTFGPQVVLLDLGMPGLDGYDTCRRLRAEYGGAIAIAALSGWGQEQDKARTAQAGFDAHLVKPTAPAELQEVLGSLSRERHHSRQT